jgi:hypothetical protein
MTSNNFDIYSLANKASAKDRATIYFDEVFSMIIKGKRKFNDGEMEALRNSFRGNEEANLFNTSLHNCICTNLFISQIEKILADANHIETTLRLTISAMGDTVLVSDLVLESLKEAEKSNCISNKKVARKIFKELKDKIQTLCSMSFGEQAVKELVDRFYNQNQEEQEPEFYLNNFMKFFKEAIARKADMASLFLDNLKYFYEKSEKNFDVVDGKIKNLEEEIENLKNLTSNFGLSAFKF